MPPGYADSRTASFDLPVDESAPSQARRVVAALLADWQVGEGHLQQDVVLLTSELVTNAVQHGAGRVTLVVAVEPEAVEISVEDGSDLLPAQPEQLTDNLYREGGRGLMIVSALASDWGVEETASVGKRIWARVPRSMPA